MSFFTLVLKGMAIGVANVVPGVSAGTFMVLLGIYDQLIRAVSDFFTDLRNLRSNLLLLIPISAGAVTGILIFANLASYVLDRYPVTAQLFFIGLILGSVPSVLKMHHDMKPAPGRLFAFVVGLGLVVFVGLLGRSEIAGSAMTEGFPLIGVLYFGVVGLFAGGAMITPGMSGSYIFLLAGTYEPIMQALSSLTQPPVLWGVLVATAVGSAAGILLWSRIISLALNRRPAVTYYVIVGLIAGSLVGLWPSSLDLSVDSVIPILAFVSGAAAAYLVGRPGAERTSEEPNDTRPTR